MSINLHDKKEKQELKIGILAVQGAFVEHKIAMEDLGVSCVLIRNKKDLDSIDGIILPGGESTVQGKLIRALDMFSTIQNKINEGLPVLGTCAGLILLASHLETLPVSVKRNAYGRQLGSFVTNENVGNIKDYPMVFIRAPYITETKNDAVEILSIVDKNIVGVKFGNQIGLSFHPEMTDDLRIHKEFLNIVEEYSSIKQDASA